MFDELNYFELSRAKAKDRKATWKKIRLVVRCKTQMTNT